MSLSEMTPSAWPEEEDAHPTSGHVSHHPAGEYYNVAADGTCRRFPRPEQYEEGKSSNPMTLASEGTSGFMYVRCPGTAPEACPCQRYTCHLDSLIVAVDGACPGNGTPRATRAGCGVYFGPGRYEPTYDGGPVRNLAFAVPNVPDQPHTSQRAELYAALAALHEAKQFALHGGQWPCEVPKSCPEPCRMRYLVIQSDSAYMVNGMTDFVTKWAANGWRTAKKTPVKNRDLWEALQAMVGVYTALGVMVDFWLVPREDNVDADDLANQGLS